MEQDKVRAEFEHAYMRDLVRPSTEGKEVWLERGSDGEYRSFQARGAWWAWQASREAQLVELPPEEAEPARPLGHPDRLWPAGWNTSRDMCRAAIHAAGIRTE